MSRPVDLAAPPADDDDLIRVLGSIERDGKLPPWVSKRDLYTDVPEVVTAACQAVPGGDGRPVFYVLTGLRSMGGHDLHISRTAGPGYWRIDKTHAIWPTAGEAGSSSSGGAPLGTSSALAFFLRAPGGAETRNGWLMKELVLRHRRGQAAGYALCKIYKKKLSKKAAVAAAAAAGRQPPLLPPLRSGCAPCSAATASPPSGCAPASAATASPPSGCAPASAATASPPPSGSTPSSSRKWLLLELEGSNSPPKTGHRLTIKRVFNLLQLDDEDIEEGEIEETLGDRKKRAKAASENAALILAPDDILHLKTVVA